MQTPATYEDANLILRLYEMRREEKLRQAREWFTKNFHCSTVEEFGTLCPPGSQENAFARQVVSYWEMAASLITSGVLNEHLFFQSGTELLLVWERIKELAPNFRQVNKNPNIWKNLELVALKFIQHLDSTDPEIYAGFAARSGARPAAAR
jgi:hypothetical protein